MLVGRNIEWTVLGVWMGHRVGEGEGRRWRRDRMGRRRMEEFAGMCTSFVRCNVLRVRGTGNATTTGTSAMRLRVSAYVTV